MKKKAALLILLALSGCNPSGEKEEAADGRPPVYAVSDSVTAVRYEDVTLFVEHALLYDEHGYLHQVNRDTVTLFLELGEQIENQTIYVSSEVLKDITIEQRYQTTAGISLEGELCELHHWKHYESGWKSLPQYKPWSFTVLSYTEEEGRRFPPVTPREYREAVERHCAGNFTKAARGINVYPGFVAISKYDFRITGTRKDTGEKTVRLLTVNLPFGC